MEVASIRVLTSYAASVDAHQSASPSGVIGTGAMRNVARANTSTASNRRTLLILMMGLLWGL